MLYNDFVIMATHILITAALVFMTEILKTLNRHRITGIHRKAFHDHEGTLVPSRATASLIRTRYRTNLPYSATGLGI